MTKNKPKRGRDGPFKNVLVLECECRKVGIVVHFNTREPLVLEVIVW